MKRLLIVLSLPVIAANSGQAASCETCHREQASAHKPTSMARALQTAEQCDILRSNPHLTFRFGPYSYTIEREGNRSLYTVTHGDQKITVPIQWAFGLGAAGQTYVFELDGQRYESRVSYYRQIGGLDMTLGANDVTPKTLREAVGRQMMNKDDLECFGCHSAGGVQQGKLQFSALNPGVQCQNCHAGSDRHAAAVQAGDVKRAALPHLAKLNAEEMSELCGKCHRTWADIAATGPRGVGNVRFQPYRLANSKCYDAFDARISCIACHDSHREVDRRAASYDAKCLACHSAQSARSQAAKQAAICRVGKAGCSGCHMPKYEIPGAHHSFSDHQIRIVRANETYPN